MRLGRSAIDFKQRSIIPFTAFAIALRDIMPPRPGRASLDFGVELFDFKIDAIIWRRDFIAGFRHH